MGHSMGGTAVSQWTSTGDRGDRERKEKEERERERERRDREPERGRVQVIVFALVRVCEIFYYVWREIMRERF